MEKQVVEVDNWTIQSLISEMVRKEIQDAVKMLVAENQPKRDEAREYLKIDEALDYINGKGLKMSRSTLYKLTAEKQIKFRRFGKRRIVFDVPELDKWINNQLEAKPNTVAKAVAASARRK